MARSCNRRRLLMLLTCLSKSSSAIMLAIALSTDFWINTKDVSYKEKQLAGEEGSENETAIHEHIGLWRMCTNRMGYFVCTRIDYFPEGLESDSSTDSEGKILQVVRASSAFPILALIVQTIATIVCFVGHYRKHKVHLILIAGVLSVLAGLCSIVGLFIYISSVSEEYASKARPRSAISDPTFYYHYGWSFWLAVTSFTLTEAAGVLSVYLYVSRHRHVIKKHVDSRKHVDAFPRLRSDSGSQDMYRLTRNQHDYYSAPHLQASDYSTDSSRDIGMSLLNSTERHPSRKLYMPRRERRLPRQHSFETVRKTTPV